MLKYIITLENNYQLKKKKKIVRVIDCNIYLDNKSYKNILTLDDSYGFIFTLD